MMQFGIETETLHLWFQNKRMDAFGFIDKAVEFGYDGIVFNIIEKKNQTDGLATLGVDTPENLAKIRDKLRENNLYVEIDTRGTGYEHLCHVLDIAEFLGANRVRTFIMGDPSSYSHGNLGGSFCLDDLKSGIEELKLIAPVLEKKRIFLAVENHENETAADMNWIVEQVNSPWIGLLYDPGNFMNAWQDPVEAVKVCAPHILGTHLRDAAVIMDGDQPVVTAMLPGRGSIDLKGVIRELVKNTTLQRFNIESSYLYTGKFKRPAGTGGCSEFTGTFKVIDPPMPADEVRPLDYYLYEGDRLEEQMELQMENMRMAGKYMKDLFEQVIAEE